MNMENVRGNMAACMQEEMVCACLSNRRTLVCYSHSVVYPNSVVNRVLHALLVETTKCSSLVLAADAGHPIAAWDVVYFFSMIFQIHFLIFSYAI